jgi:hypothetical protein
METMLTIKNNVSSTKLFITLLLLIALRLFPAFYFLSLGLSANAATITEALFDVYAITFRPFVYSLLMLFCLWILGSDRLSWFNKYFWYWVRGDRPHLVIYLWLAVIVGAFGIACLASGLVTVLIGSDSPLSMFNIRDDIFYSAVAAFLISPIVMVWHLSKKPRMQVIE